MVRYLLVSILLCMIACATTGCVSEWGNEAIGNLVKDPEPLETPKDPDEPIFNPNSERLIEHTREEEITDRFENR